MNTNGSLLGNRILTLDQAVPGTGPIAPTIDIQLSPRSETYMNLDNNIRSKVDNNFIPTINAQDERSQQYVNDKYVNFTGREQISPTVVEQTNLKGHDEFHNLSIKNARVTTNQTTNFSYSGNAQREHDGSNFYRYKDKPRVTTNQTTNFSYTGNAQREHDGSNFYRYKDKPRVTTNQTTNFSYTGDVNGNVTSFNPTNRVQFTGTTYFYTDENGKECHYKSPDSGVTNWGQGESTLVQNYFPGSNGGMNIQMDPDEKIGNTEMKADWDIINAEGVGSYARAVPNAEHFQQVSSEFIGDIRFNPNKTESVDNRQTANYLITNLKENCFSIYQDPKLRNNKCDINFFIDSNPQNFSGTQNLPLKSKPIEKIKRERGVVSVYGKNNDMLYNPNSIITHNTNGMSNDKIENPLLFQKTVANNYAQFNGLGYPGNAISANNQNPNILLDTNSQLSSLYLNSFSN